MLRRAHSRWPTLRELDGRFLDLSGIRMEEWDA
jgi:hypothetical protein